MNIPEKVADGFATEVEQVIASDPSEVSATSKVGFYYKRRVGWLHKLMGLAAKLVGFGEEQVFLRSATPQNIADLTGTAVIWGTVVHDEAALFNAATPTLVTIRSTGRYLILADVVWAANAVGYRAANLEVSAASVKAIDQRMAVTVAAIETSLHLGTEVDLVAGDTLRVMVTQNSGGPLGLVGGLSVYGTKLIVKRIG